MFDPRSRALYYMILSTDWSNVSWIYRVSDVSCALTASVLVAEKYPMVAEFTLDPFSFPGQMGIWRGDPYNTVDRSSIYEPQAVSPVVLPTSMSSVVLDGQDLYYGAGLLIRRHLSNGEDKIFPAGQASNTSKLGLALSYSCADTDGDGINDCEDGCPSDPRYQSEWGCPALNRDRTMWISRGLGAMNPTPYNSSYPSISFDGRYLAFSSANRFTEQSNGYENVYLRDLLRGSTETISLPLASGAGFMPSVSAAGAYVAFVSDRPELVNKPLDPRENNIYLRTRSGASPATLLPLDPVLSHPRSKPFITRNGRFLIYESYMLVGQDRYPESVILQEIVDGVPGIPIPMPALPGSPPLRCPCAVTPDGRYVAFSAGLSPQKLYLWDRSDQQNLVVEVSRGFGGDASNPSLDDTGRYVAFSGDPSPTPAYLQVFIYDRLLGQYASLPNVSGSSYNPVISADGKTVVFTWEYQGVPQLWLHDRESSATVLLSAGYNGGAGDASSDWASFGSGAKSAGKLMVAFASYAKNLVADPPSDSAQHIYVRVLADSDCDGRPDATDLDIDPNGCPGDSLADSDGDGTPDISDGCPSDPAKQTPGVCGCGSPETDSNADGIVDCGKAGGGGVPTPTPPPQSPDGDGDGLPDAEDPCPNDPNNPESGGVFLCDEDGNGTPDYYDETGAIVTPKTPLSPPYVVPREASVVLYLEPFSGASLDTGKSAAMGKKRSKKLGFRYEVVVESISGKKVRIRKTVRKNRITLNKLKLGSYKVKYRVQIVSSGKVVAKTDFSPASSFDLSH